MNGKTKDNIIPYKIVLLGDVFVGKTFLASRFVKGSVPDSNSPTIGVEFSTKKETLKNGTAVKAQIWDTAGQERYRSVTSAHFRKAAGALVVFDLTNEKSFESVEKWTEELRTHAGSDVRVFLLGNKYDEVARDESKRAVRYADASKFASKNNMVYAEVSALSGENVRETFLAMLESINSGKPIEPTGGMDMTTKTQGTQCSICSC